MPQTGELGNYPQAFSHIVLINAAWAIAEAAERRTSDISDDLAAILDS